MERENRNGPPDGRASYPSLSQHWKEVYGTKVRKITLDAGFSCPNRGALGEGGCVFCDPASFSPASGDGRSIADQLHAGIDRGRDRDGGLFAAYFQPRTNTYASLETLAKVWGEAAAFPEVVALCVGTRPDCIPDEVLDLLAGYGDRFKEIWLELGLQSSNDSTLKRLNRGHDATCFADGAGRAKTRGLLVCAHVILGLPGENAETESKTARFLADLRVDGVKIHQLAVIRGTPLADEYRHGDFACLTEEEYAARTVAFVRALPETTVLHRLVGDSIGDTELAPRFDKNRVLELIAKRLKVSR